MSKPKRLRDQDAPLPVNKVPRRLEKEARLKQIEDNLAELLRRVSPAPPAPAPAPAPPAPEALGSAAWRHVKAGLPKIAVHVVSLVIFSQLSPYLGGGTLHP